MAIEPIRPYVPQYITVHLGPPDSNAENVTVTFPDYIKNVASSEIYPTWDEDAIVANILAQISFTLNRIYTEFYTSQGYDFNITSSTAYDQKFINGRNIFENIDRIVDRIFTSYIRRVGFTEPLAAKYCNGTTVTCNGLSQWGSQTLAQQGYQAYDILRYYYGDDIEIVNNAPISNITSQYPGTPLRLGDRGDAVAILQTQLNEVSNNYPAIPKLTVDGIFGETTQDAVKTFQSIFNLTPDGIVGEATWNRLLYLYVGINRLAELNSQGDRLLGISLEYPEVISEGDSGQEVTLLQYFLSVLSEFYTEIPFINIDGIYGTNTKNAVTAFQRLAGLPQTGVVGEATWNELYEAFMGIADNRAIEEYNRRLNAILNGDANYSSQELSYGDSDFE